MATQDETKSRTRRWLRETEKDLRLIGERFFDKPRPHMKCRDGFSMSVQAGYGLYCNHYDGLIRDPDGALVYETVEVFCLSGPEPLLNPYGAENGLLEDPAGYVPVSVVDRIILAHGGLENDPPPPAPLPITKRRKLNLGAN